MSFKTSSILILKSFFDLDIKVFGPFYGTRFRGVVSTIIYDLGYFGSIIFLLLYLILMRLLLKKYYLTINQLHIIIILVLFLTFFFQANILVLAYISIAIVYMILVGIYFKFKIGNVQ